jgi:hypothetical protein
MTHSHENDSSPFVGRLLAASKIMVTHAAKSELLVSSRKIRIDALIIQRARNYRDPALELKIVPSNEMSAFTTSTISTDIQNGPEMKPQPIWF